MVVVDVQIASAGDVEVDQAVAADLVEHVLEKRHAGVKPAPAGAVQIDGHGDLGFAGVAAHGGDARLRRFGSGCKRGLGSGFFRFFCLFFFRQMLSAHPAFRLAHAVFELGLQGRLNAAPFGGFILCLPFQAVLQLIQRGGVVVAAAAGKLAKRTGFFDQEIKVLQMGLYFFHNPVFFINRSNRLHRKV